MPVHPVNECFEKEGDKDVPAMSNSLLYYTFRLKGIKYSKTKF